MKLAHVFRSGNDVEIEVPEIEVGLGMTRISGERFPPSPQDLQEWVNEVLPGRSCQLSRPWPRTESQALSRTSPSPEQIMPELIEFPVLARLVGAQEWAVRLGPAQLNSRRITMARTCTICANPKRAEIDEALVSGGESIRGISRRFRVTDDALSRHKESHLPKTLVRAHQAGEVRRAGILMDRIATNEDRSERLYGQAEAILDRALEAEDLKTALTAIRAGCAVLAEARQLAELRGKATGELGGEAPVAVERALIIMPRASDLETMGKGKGPLAFMNLPPSSEESDG
jgi:hypothetical protein